MSGRTSGPPGTRSITFSSLLSTSSENLAAPVAICPCATLTNSRRLVSARSRSTLVALSTRDADVSLNGGVRAATPSTLRRRSAATVHRATPSPMIAVGTGWRLLAKSNAPPHDKSAIPARVAASEARFDGLRLNRSSSIVAPIWALNRLASASHSLETGAFRPTLKTLQQRRNLRDALHRRQPRRRQAL